MTVPDLYMPYCVPFYFKNYSWVTLEILRSLLNAEDFLSFDSEIPALILYYFKYKVAFLHMPLITFSLH